MPTVLVGANVDGKPNFMLAAFAGLMNIKPPAVFLGLNPAHRTSEGIVANRTFSLNLPHAGMVEVMDYCGLHSGAKKDKSQLFKTYYGDLQTAPLIEECRFSAECRLVHAY